MGFDYSEFLLDPKMDYFSLKSTLTYLVMAIEVVLKLGFLRVILGLNDLSGESVRMIFPLSLKRGKLYWLKVNET